MLFNMIEKTHKLPSHERTQNEGRFTEAERPIEVTKLHFLVHPGYAVDNLSNAVKKEFVALLDMYERYAAALLDDELLIVFKEYKTFHNDSDATLREEWRRYKKPTDEELQKREMLLEIAALPDKRWVDCIEALRKVLGRRLIVLGGEHDIFSEDSARETIRLIETVGRARGFSILPDAEKVCFGEYGDACVKVAVRELAKAFGINEPLLISEEFTDRQIRERLGLWG